MWGFGPAAGFAFSSVCTNIYVTLESNLINSLLSKIIIKNFLAPVGMTSKDPNWIGAWWLGLLINGCLLLLFGAPLYLFPSHMKRSKDRELTNVNQLSQPKESEDLVKTNKKPEQITAETNSNWFKDIFDKLISMIKFVRQSS